MTSDFGNTTPTPHGSASRLAAAGWGPFQDRLVLGLCHDVNGRVTSLQAVTQLVDMGEPLPETFGIEVERLEELAERMSVLYGNVEAPPIPFSLPELLERAAKLYGQLKSGSPETVRLAIQEGTPPVLINEGRCLRYLLLFLDEACTTGESPEVTLEVVGDREGVQLWFKAGPGTEAPGLDALDELVQLDSGEVIFEAGRWVLRLPSLSRARDILSATTAC